MRYYAYFVLLVLAYPVKAETWAMVVGVSEYKYITDLQFADDDARAFESFLIHGLNDRIKGDHILQLLNEKATGAAILNGFKWLMDNAKESDLVIIYFAGHGGYEDLTFRKFGFLLGYDGHNESYTAGGNIPLDYLSAILQTFETKNIRALLVTDACHAGKIGENPDGFVYINERLAGEANSATKILSAQGSEFSFEDKKWGGGHGAFTYNLIKGLLGFADNSPKDDFISVREISQFLGDKVPAETEYKQNPRVIGLNRNLNLVKVNPAAFQLFENTFRQDPEKINLIDAISRGLAKEIHEDTHASLTGDQKIISDQFEKAFLDDNLFGNDSSAFSLYSQLIATEVSDFAISRLRMRLSTRLEEGAQAVINNYLEGELRYAEDYMEASKALEKVLILEKEKKNVLTKDLERIEARKIFLSVYGWFLNLRESEPRIKEVEWLKSNSNTFKLKVDELKYAITLDPNGAYVYNLKGLLLDYLLGENQEAIQCLLKARTLAPNWQLPIANLGTSLNRKSGHDKEVLAYYDTLLQLNPYSVIGYHNLADFYYQKGDKALSLTHWKKAETLIEMNPPNNYLMPSVVYQGLGQLYFEAKEYSSSLKYFKLAGKLNYLQSKNEQRIAQLLSLTGQHEESISAYKNLIDKGLAEDSTYLSIAQEYAYLRDFESAATYCDLAISGELEKLKRDNEIKTDKMLYRWTEENKKTAFSAKTYLAFLCEQGVGTKVKMSGAIQLYKEASSSNQCASIKYSYLINKN